MKKSPDEPAVKEPLTVRNIRELYDQGVNIMGFCRDREGVTQNSLDTILLSYDLQSGSYTRAALEDAEYRRNLEHYAGVIAGVLDDLEGETLLEVGVGEATTFCHVLSRLRRMPSAALGFDLSWSRVVCAQKYAGRFPELKLQLFTGDLFAAPLPDSSVDVVFTSHSIEPNHGREREALQELYRITRRWLVLFEPTYELGNDATRKRIEEHGYIRNLPAIARELGYRITRHELLDSTWSPQNQTGLMVIAKEPAASAASPPALACPICKAPLDKVRGHCFCGNCLKVFPVLDGIPCLLPANGILASKYPEAVS